MYNIFLEIEFFKDCEKYWHIYFDNETKLSNQGKEFLIETSLFLINETKQLAKQIFECFELNYLSISPIPEKQIVNLINTYFNQIPKNDYTNFMDILVFNAGYREGVINSIKEYLQINKEISYISLKEYIYSSTINQFPELKELYQHIGGSKIDNFFPVGNDFNKVFEHLKFKIDLLKIDLEIRNNNLENSLTGFNCKLHPEIANGIYSIMKSEKQISGDLKDFQAIFTETESIQNPIKWLLKHDNKPNKTALFTFLKMILKLDEVPRELLRQANQYFVFGNENIFERTYTYPDIKSQRSSYLKHFKQIKQKYFPDFLKE